MQPFNQKNIVSFLFIFIGLSVLMVGEISYIARLRFFDEISFNQLLFVTTFFFTFLIISILGIESRSLKLLFFIIPISFSLLWSENVDYGLYKIGNLFLSSYIALIFFSAAIKLTSISFLSKVILKLLLFLLIITIFYKINYGFFDREVLFFLNGPIVFGRLMGIGAILTLVSTSSKLKKGLYFMVFAIAVIWTASKGPILALFTVTLIYAIFFMNLRQQIVSLIAVIVLGLLAYGNPDVLRELGLIRLIDTITYLFSENENFSSRSISLRWAVLNESFQALLTNSILGVGLGDWASNVLNLGFIYPHNFFAEVFVEGGMLLGFLFCIPYLIFLKNPKSMLFLVSFYLLLSQQVSGDILDSRYWLVFSILCFCYKIDFRAIRSRPIKNRFSKRLKKVNHN